MRRGNWRLISSRTGSLSDRVSCRLRLCGEKNYRAAIAPSTGLITDWRSSMPKYVIEREIPGAGNMSPQDLQAVSQKSCSVLQNLGPQIQWVQSYVTGDKTYCVYIAPNEDMIREHALQGGFPANRISQIKSIIDP